MTPRPASSRAPLRLSLAGGGTDLPEWYERHGARLLAVAVDVWVEVRRVDREPADETPVAALARRTCPDLGPLEVTSDVSGGAGLGGSGAVATAVAALAAAVAGEELDALGIALRAYGWERHGLGHPTGFQDHVCAAVGGCVEMAATPDGAVTAHRRHDLEDALDDVLARCVVVAETGVRRPAARLLRGLASSLSEMPDGAAAGLATVDEVADAVAARDGRWFGDILRRHWAAKLRLSPDAAWPAAAHAIAAAAAAGATGAKVVGAGGGGFLMLSGPAGANAEIRAAVSAAGCRPIYLTVARRGVTVDGDPGRAGSK